MTQDPFATLVHPFAIAIHAKSALLVSGQLTKRQRARVMESVSDDLKKCCDVLVPDVLHPRVSEAAHARAVDLGVDLTCQAWQDQPKFDRGRDVFHLEHVAPISSLRAWCLAAQDEQEIVELLRTRVAIAWILKEEDRALTRLGHRHERPDPDAAYAAAGIRLREPRQTAPAPLKHVSRYPSGDEHRRS